MYLPILLLLRPLKTFRDCNRLCSLISISKGILIKKLYHRIFLNSCKCKYVSQKSPSELAQNFLRLYQLSMIPKYIHDI